MDQLIKILQANEIMALTFYNCDNYCKFIRCIDTTSGVFFLLKNYDTSLSTPKTFNTIELKRAESVPIVDTNASCHSPIDINNSKVDALYESIYIDPKGKQYRDVYEQIVRIGSCFSRLHVRPVIEANAIFCEMRDNFTLNWFETPHNYTRLKSWCIVTNLYTFIQKPKETCIYIEQIEGRLKDIFAAAHIKHMRMLTTSNLYAIVKSFSTTTSRNKIKIQNKIGDDVLRLKKVQERIKHYKMQQTKLESGSSNEETAAMVTTLSKQLSGLRENALDIVIEISNKSEQLKEFYLQCEHLLYEAAQRMTALQLYD